MWKRNVFTGVTKWNLRTWSNQGFLYNIPSCHGALWVVINAQLSWGPAAAGGGLDFDWGVAPPWFFSLSVADLNLMLVNHCPVCAECSLWDRWRCPTGLIIDIVESAGRPGPVAAKQTSPALHHRASQLVWGGLFKRSFAGKVMLPCSINKMEFKKKVSFLISLLQDFLTSSHTICFSFITSYKRTDSQGSRFSQTPAKKLPAWHGKGGKYLINIPVPKEGVVTGNDLEHPAAIRPFSTEQFLSLSGFSSNGC